MGCPTCSRTSRSRRAQSLRRGRGSGMSKFFLSTSKLPTLGKENFAQSLQCPWNTSTCPMSATCVFRSRRAGVAPLLGHAAWEGG